MPDIDLEYNNHIKNKYDNIRKYRIFLAISCMIKTNNETLPPAVEDRIFYNYTSMFIFSFINSNLKLYDTLNLNFDDFISKIDTDPDYQFFKSYRQYVDKEIHAKVKSQIRNREKVLTNRYIGSFSNTKHNINLSKYGFKVTSSLNNIFYFSINSGYIRLDSVEKNGIVTKKNYIIEKFQFLETFICNMDYCIDIEDCYLKDIVHMLKM